MKERAPKVLPSESKTAYAIPLERGSDHLNYGQLELYMPRTFKATTMMVGNPESPTALCTCWSDPWDVVKEEEEIRAFSIIAPLREAGGLDIMLHNLAANPQIRCVVIHGAGRFDTTEAAQRPISLLKTLWENGIEDNGRIKETNYQLFPELVENGGIDVIRQVVADVTVLDCSHLSISEVAEKARQQSFPLSEREKVRFPEFKIGEVETLPSEEVCFQVRERNAQDAWLGLIDRIMRYGRDCSLETGGALVREIQYARVVIEEDPARFFDLPDWIGSIEGIVISPASLESYYQRYIKPDDYYQEIYPGVFKFVRPEEEKYLYAELLFAFPRPKEIDTAVSFILQVGGVGKVLKFLRENFELKHPQHKEIISHLMKDESVDDMRKIEVLLEIFVPPVNQIKDKVRRIKEKPDDADKTIILWDPRVHGLQDRGRPCWLELSLMVRGGMINSKAVFRSHDIAKGWLFNTYGTWRLCQEKICAETGYPMGKLVIESESAHVYQGDKPWVRRLWEREILEASPQRVFEAERADPRGNFAISVLEGKIICLLKSPDGKPLVELKGRTAKQVMGLLNHHNLISQVSHGLDIGAELTKAEMCLKLGVLFVQDKPLSLKDIR